MPLLLAYGYFRNGQVTGALHDPAAMSREIWFGAMVLAAFALHFIWMRLFNNGATRVPASAPWWERKLSASAHLSLYGGVAATHPPITNFAIVTGIARINDMSTTNGLFAEGLLAMEVQTNPDMRDRLEAFFTKKTKRLEPDKA